MPVRTLRAALVVTMALGGLLASGTAASAHSYLVSSAPADHESFATAPPAVVLTFNEAVNNEFSEILVTGPDGATVQAGDPEVSGATVTQPLDADDARRLRRRLAGGFHRRPPAHRSPDLRGHSGGTHHR